MKKTVPFPLFGDDNDYLTLSVGDLIIVEEMMGGESIVDIWGKLINGQYTLKMIYTILPIAYADCAKNAGKEVKIDELMEQGLEKGVGIGSYAVPIARAIVESGIFGHPKNEKRTVIQTERRSYRRGNGWKR